MQERVLSALDDSGVFTAGGLVRDKVSDLLVATFKFSNFKV